MSHTIPQSWIQSPLAHALGWALFHFLWEGAAVAAMLWVALLCSRRASARRRYSAACLALLAMAVVFGATFAMELPREAAPGAGILTHVYVLDAVATANAGAAAGGSPRLADGLAWAGPFWLAGVIGFFFYRLGSWLAAQRLRRVGTVAAACDWQDRMQALARAAGIARPVALLESCLAEMPMVIGYLKPAILAPLGMLAGLPSDQVEAILLHELAHIRRADYLVNLMQIAVENLLFYHPAVWWVSSVIRSERENCCDDWAAARHGDAHGYARALVTLEESPWRAPETALAATGGNLLRRIRRLIGKPDGGELGFPVLPALLLAVVGAAALAAFAPAPQAPATTPQPQRKPAIARQVAPSPAAAPEPAVEPAAEPAPAPLQQDAERHTPYQKWLNEDVAYIIMPEERQAFLKLETDDEREKFIEQFWLGRDPTPGTLANEYKVEHYRRIAYANEHFATQIPGWKTNRGRIYIVYGPPDEIVAQQENIGLYHALSETWRYRFVEGLGFNTEFVFTVTERGDTMRVNNAITATFTGSASGTPLPGGSHTAVQVRTGGFVDFSVPVGFASGTLHVLGTVRTSTRRPVANFEEEVTAAGPVYSRQLHLAPGSYVAGFVIKDMATGLQYTESAEFEVK